MIASPQEASDKKVKPTPTKAKKCKVVRYVPETGILGFYFDGVPCQMTVRKGLSIGRFITVKYEGDLKSGLKFRL